MSDWPDDREAMRAKAGLHSNFTSAPRDRRAEIMRALSKLDITEAEAIKITDVIFPLFNT